jgi:SAM-dependent methyltransferase
MTEAVAELQTILDRLLERKQIEHVLEAGCGSASHIRIAYDACLTGIDISEKQLARNHALDEKILGDLQTYALPESHFDVIVCCDVLEHLPHPTDALENLVRAIKEDGLIVLALPNLYSMKGILTKFTPFWFHVWVRRYLFGEKEAGTDDNGPFPTFLRLSIAPEAMNRFARERGLVIEYFRVYESQMHRLFKERHRKLGAVWSGLGLVVQALSRNRITADRTDYIVLLRKSTRRV